MNISSEIENVEKVENWRERIWEKGEKSILRAFARTRAKNCILHQQPHNCKHFTMLGSIKTILT